MPDATISPIPLSAFETHMRSVYSCIIISLFVFTACKKSDIADGIPSCIHKEIAVNKIKSNWSISSVDEYLFQNKLVYVFIPRPDLADDPFIIKDDNCNTVCIIAVYGHPFPPPTMCNGEIFFQAAVKKRTIWKKE
jgi:hypothetical protein